MARTKKFIVTPTDDKLNQFPAEVRDLVKKGREHGFVTQQELMKAIPAIEDDLMLLDEIYGLFLDLGIEPYLIAATLGTVIGQRLVRKLCPACRTKTKLTAAVYKNLPEEIQSNLSPTQPIFTQGEGCTECDGNGFRGRVGIYEVMPISEPLRTAILKKSSSNEIRRVAVTEGMLPMITDGCRKISQGLTTMEEILSVF